MPSHDEQSLTTSQISRSERLLSPPRLLPPHYLILSILLMVLLFVIPYLVANVFAQLLPPWFGDWMSDLLPWLCALVGRRDNAGWCVDSCHRLSPVCGGRDEHHSIYRIDHTGH